MKRNVSSTELPDNDSQHAILTASGAQFASPPAPTIEELQRTIAGLEQANEALRAEVAAMKQRMGAMDSERDAISDGFEYWKSTWPQKDLFERAALAAMQGDWAAQECEYEGVFTNEATDELLSERAALYIRAAKAFIKAWEGQS
jgi:hypothetical protein